MRYCVNGISAVCHSGRLYQNYYGARFRGFANWAVTNSFKLKFFLHLYFAVLLHLLIFTVDVDYSHLTRVNSE